jgi:hypothetical protein
LVKEITLDMANNMQLVSRKCFAESTLVIARFHVVKLVMEALHIDGKKYRKKINPLKVHRTESKI